MTENAKNILDELLKAVPDSLNKSESSVIYTSLAPIAIKIDELECENAEKYNDAYIDTASLDALKIKVKERNIKYLDALKAIIEAEIICSDDTADLINTQFFTEGGVLFTVISKNDADTYLLECTDYGSKGNIDNGTLIFDGRGISVTSATIIGVSTYGREAETEDELRQRYYDSFNAFSFGGNIADYRAKCLEISGIGGVQVCRAWNGGGTVKLVVLGSDYTVLDADSSVVKTAQSVFDPSCDGSGEGLAPIDHIVTVVAAESSVVNIKTTIEFETGISYENVEALIDDALTEYFRTLRSDWDKKGKAVVRAAKIENLIAEVSGVLDCYDTVLNSSSASLVFDGDMVPVYGSVEVN